MLIDKLDDIIEKIEWWNYKNKELMLSFMYNKEDNIILNEWKINKLKIFYNNFYNEIYNIIKKYNFKKENIFIFDNYYIFNIEDNTIKNIFIYKLWKKPNLQLKKIIKWLKI